QVIDILLALSAKARAVRASHRVPIGIARRRDLHLREHRQAPSTRKGGLAIGRRHSRNPTCDTRSLFRAQRISTTFPPSNRGLRPLRESLRFAKVYPWRSIVFNGPWGGLGLGKVYP